MRHRGSPAFRPDSAGAGKRRNPMNSVETLCLTDRRETGEKIVAASRKDLGETGFVEGQDVAIQFRWAEDQIDRTRKPPAWRDVGDKVEVEVEKIGVLANPIIDDA